MGAGLGRAFGEYTQISAQAYAIVGCGATLGGITRVLISISIILSDGIGFNYFLVPLMLVFLCARTFGNMISEVSSIHRATTWCRYYDVPIILYPPIHRD